MQGALYLPALTLHFDDISGVSDDALRARAMTLFGKLALSLLRTVRGGRIDPSSLHWWRSALQALAAQPGGKEVVEALLRYLHKVLGEERQAVNAHLLAGDTSGRVREAYMTLSSAGPSGSSLRRGSRTSGRSARG